MNECRCMINTAKQLYKQVTYHCCHQCFNFRWQHNAAEKDGTEQQQCVHHACAGRLFHCWQTTAAQAASVGAAAARHLQYRHNINQSLSHYCPLTCSFMKFSAHCKANCLVVLLQFQFLFTVGFGHFRRKSQFLVQFGFCTNAQFFRQAPLKLLKAHCFGNRRLQNWWQILISDYQC